MSFNYKVRMSRLHRKIIYKNIFLTTTIESIAPFESYVASLLFERTVLYLKKMIYPLRNVSAYQVLNNDLLFIEYTSGTGM